MVSPKGHADLDLCACLMGIAMVSNLNSLCYACSNNQFKFHLIFLFIHFIVECAMRSGEPGNGQSQGSCDAGRLCSFGICVGKSLWRFLTFTLVSFVIYQVYKAFNLRSSNVLFLDQCCSQLSINSTGLTLEDKPDLLGKYTKIGYSNGRIVYKNTDFGRYLHFAPNQNWVVSSNYCIISFYSLPHITRLVMHDLLMNL